MNIIQLQDRLKGLPEEALVNYVKNPMGEVPIYLALGEMQRRNDMKARYEAIKPEESSIAEKLVGEAEKRTGIAKMVPQRMMPGGQGVGTPPPTPQIDSRQLATSGIAANPVNNVGRYAEGGIVPGFVPGFKVGGQFTDDLIKKQAAEKAKNITEDVVEDAAVAGTISSAADKTKGKATGILSNLKGVPGKALGLANKNKILTTLGLLYGANSIFGGDDNDSDLKQPPAKTIASSPSFNPANISKKTSKKDLIAAAKAQQELIRDMIGVDTAREDTRARAEERKGDALNMALIRGGLGMASGQSANFIDNLATGATAGVESYAKTTDEVDDILANIDKQQRAEEVAIATKALDMDAAQRKSDRDLELAKIASTGQTSGGYYSVKQQNVVSEALGKDQDYQNHKILATQLRARAETKGGLSDDDLQALATAEAAMKLAEDDVYKRFNMKPPQQTVGQNNQVYNVDY
mgnify:FL=1